MRRRDFIALLSGSVVARPRIAVAEPKRAMPLVGAVWVGKPTAPITLRVMEAFRRGLREDGYVEGENLTIEHKYGVDLDEFRKAVNGFLNVNVDVIAAGGTPAALAAKQATNTIPIVAANMADPIGDGLVSSFARPGGNLTGNTFIGPERGPKRLQLLREIVPGGRRDAA